ncbi:hypothetical protein EK0264_03070 [Epidermidibacterium keratini]|uniref:AbiEi antitoxin N-terminal domain-containing protein n=1 Tax=Epidermidibacterium keratini TaxID=1891644 RepID=A0A7L4YLE3_9ACTN|nr:type IV toxin-antitoxin system AbiEi family antitoxin domain-containing protein [Epidermidibacterium keratini]QHB99366.1 hypothetical protein EK0264_03070 [Epidermidibacterium keratini]
MDNRAVAELLDRQNGVISRAQAVACGAGEHDIRRLVRRNEWARVHTGVYVNHTGPLTWQQRAWAAVLYGEPAALSHASARRAADGPGRRSYDDGEPMQIAIDGARSIRPQAGIEIHRINGLSERALWHTSPPRVRPEEAVIDLAAIAARDIDAIGYLADAVRARITTPARLQAALARRTRVNRRRFLEQVIGDIAEGTCSALEHGYLVRVERRHGLPTARRQFRESAKGTLYRDAEYAEFGVIMELDGRMYHSSVRDRDLDLERDLAAFATGRVTARLGWGQVFDRGCRTAHTVGLALNNRGWRGEATSCRECPPALTA